MAVTVGARCWCWLVLVLVLLMVLLEAESTPSVVMCDPNQKLFLGYIVIECKERERLNLPTEKIGYIL